MAITLNNLELGAMGWPSPDWLLVQLLYHLFMHDWAYIGLQSNAI